MNDLTIDEDDIAEFICQYSRPVQASWKKNDVGLSSDGKRIIVEQDWNVAKLTIKSVVPEDRGVYVCEADGTRVVAMLQVEGEVFHRLWKTLTSCQCNKPTFNSDFKFLQGFPHLLFIPGFTFKVASWNRKKSNLLVNWGDWLFV